MPNYNCCRACGDIFETERGFADYCPDCNTSAKRRRNAQRFRAIQQRVADAKRGRTPQRSGLTLSDAICLSNLTRGRMSYGVIMDRYGSLDFDTAREFMFERGEVRC